MQGKDSGAMSFWEHLDALRSTIFTIVEVLICVSVLLFAFMPTIFDKVIMAPCFPNFPLYSLFHASSGWKVELINIQLASQFFVHMSTSLWLGLVLSMPICIYLLWQFVAPALYDHEKRGALTAFTVGSVLFFTGVAVGYFVVLPITLRFLADYHVSQYIPNQISLDSYINTFMMLIFVMGAVFELPILAWMLSLAGILRRRHIAQFRRHAVVAILVVAEVITPTGDPFTLVIVAAPIYLLYELSAILVKK